MKRIAFLISIVLGFIACEEITEVEDLSNRIVTVLAPVHSTVLDTTSVSFTWEAVEAAEIYHLQVATPTFENATQIVVDSTLSKTSLKKTLPPNSYEWRIRAENSGYHTSYTKQSFTIEE